MGNGKDISFYSVLRWGARLALCCGAAFVVSGCADVQAPQWLTGEPSKEVVQAERRVQNAPSQQSSTWPNLADVPQKPKDFTSVKEREGWIAGMQDDQDEAVQMYRQNFWQKGQ